MSNQGQDQFRVRSKSEHVMSRSDQVRSCQDRSGQVRSDQVSSGLVR